MLDKGILMKYNYMINLIKDILICGGFIVSVIIFNILILIGIEIGLIGLRWLL